MKHFSRKTAIICTYGPSISSVENIVDMIDAGMDIMRLNFSHGDGVLYTPIIEMAREAGRRTDRDIALLQDLGGPKIRVGLLPEEGIDIENGSCINLVSGKEYNGVDIPVNYKYLLDDVNVKDRILFADGTLEGIVTDRTDDKLVCKIIHGGKLLPRKGVNLPSSNLRITALTDKDLQDLEFGLKAGIDIVAVSFVQNAEDVKLARDIINKSEHKPLLIAKIEKPNAVKNLSSILEHVDGLMVARGDLGVEMPHEEVPVVQKNIISMARRAGKIVITATQMLSSMVNNPRPTRAETSDAANAIIDGSDALMLSDETAVGKFPIKAVETLVRISGSTEKYSNICTAKEFSYYCFNISSAIGHAAVTLSKELGAAAILCYTRTGGTAQSVSRFRPECPVIGLTPDDKTIRKLRILWGVTPVIAPEFTLTDEIFNFSRKWALENNIGMPGSNLVITAGFPLGEPGSTNLIKVVTI